MKKLTLTLVLLILSIVGYGQNIPNMDTIGGILLVSQHQSLDKPVLSLFKRSQETGIVINLNEKDIFVFVEGEFSYSAKIKEFNMDSTGHIHINFDVCFKRGMGTVENINSKLCYTVGDDSLTLVIGNKVRRHTKIKYEFSKIKYF